MELRPHELAAELANADYEVVNGQVESERLGSLILRAEGVWQSLAEQSFEEDEHGRVSLELAAAKNEDGPIQGTVRGIGVTYNTPRGQVTRLGGVEHLALQPRKATAYAHGAEGREALLPDDRRWDAIVGTVERAINISWDVKNATDSEPGAR